MDAKTTIQAAKLLSIPLAFGLAGYGVSTSQNCIPHLYDKPASISTSIFAHVFHDGATVVIPSAIVSAVASAYLAYTLPDERLLWTVASTTPIATLAYTSILMMPDIQRLLSISQSNVELEKVERNREHVALLKKWAAHNHVRAAMYFTGGMCGLLAVVGI